MERLRAYWASGWVGKVVLSVAGLFGLLTICCIALVAFVPRSSTTVAPTAAPAAAQPTIAGIMPTAVPPPTETPRPTAAPLPTEAPTQASTDTPAPTDTPGPTHTPAPPTITPMPGTLIRAAVVNALGASNRNVERLTVAELDGQQIHVQWAINDNLTENMVKRGARLEVKDILEALAGLDVPYETVLLEGTFSLVDTLGNTTESVVVRAIYTHGTIEKINFQNFLLDNVYAAAQEATIHPAFHEE